MDFFCQSAEARIAFGVALNALIYAQHQKEILFQVVFGFVKLFFGEMGIQILNGWGRLLFHALTLSAWSQRQKTVKLAQPGK
jgi:hypothetical protein